MLKIIAAVADNGIIGNGDELPWKLSDDMKWFKQKTLGHTVVGGNNTYRSMGFKPLPDRNNLVLSRRQIDDLSYPELTFTNNWDSILKRAETEDVWIIGGAEIYRLAMPYAAEFHLTRIHGNPEGNIFFPEWNESEWILGWEGSREADERHEFKRTWQVYFRNTPIYQFANTRTQEQVREMVEGIKKNICPFCFENLGITHKAPVLYETDRWYVTANDYPYNDTELHILIIPKQHLESITDVSPDAWADFHSCIQWVKENLGFDGGGFALRDGNPLLSGSSIKHIHTHLIKPKLGKMISFPVGCYKTSQFELP